MNLTAISSSASQLQIPTGSISIKEIKATQKEITEKISKQITHFHQVREKCIRAYTEAHEEAQLNPAPLCKRYGVTNLGDLLNILEKMHTGPINIAFDAANKQLKLIEKSIDLFLKVHDTCSSALLKDFETVVKIRMQALSVIEREMELENKQKQMELSLQADQLKIKIEGEVHQMEMLERSFAMTMEEKKTTHQIELEKEKQKLQGEIARKELMIKEKQVDGEHLEKMTKLVHDKTIKLAQIDQEIEIEKGKQKTQVLVSEIQAEAETKKATMQAMSQIVSSGMQTAATVATGSSIGNVLSSSSPAQNPFMSTGYPIPLPTMPGSLLRKETSSINPV